MQKVFGISGGVIGALAIMVFAVQLSHQNIPQNIATWVMWATLDFCILVSMYKAGNHRPWLPLGFTVGALGVVCILFSKGVWSWGAVESLSLMGVIVSMICWFVFGPRAAVVALSFAMTVAGIPLLMDMYLVPQPSTIWFWASIVASCFLTLLSAKKWSIEECCLPLASMAYNGTLIAFILTA